MVRRGPWQEFPQQLSGMGASSGVFYRRRTAVERNSRSELQQSGPQFAPALNGRASAFFCAHFGGTGCFATTSVRGWISLFIKGLAGASEHQRSGSADGRVRAHGAPLHRHRPPRLKAAAGWAQSHRAGRDRGVLALTRAANLCAASCADGRPRAGACASGAQHDGPSGAPTVGPRQPGVRSLRGASGGLAGQARLEIAVRIGGVP
jgi:hypothetical protein